MPFPVIQVPFGGATACPGRRASSLSGGYKWLQPCWSSLLRAPLLPRPRGLRQGWLLELPEAHGDRLSGSSFPAPLTQSEPCRPPQLLAFSVHTITGCDPFKRGSGEDGPC